MSDQTEAGINIHAAVHDALLPKLVSPALDAQMSAAPNVPHALIIECNADYPDGMPAAKEAVRGLVRGVAGETALSRDTQRADGDFVYVLLDQASLRAVLTSDGTNALVSDTARASLQEMAAPSDAVGAVAPPAPRLAFRAIRRVWKSTKLERLATESIRTVKADAAHASFMALGSGIVWAILDSGVDAGHPHFKKWNNVLVDAPLKPKNFSPTSSADPLQDKDGHGTHVAGIVAGQWDGPAAAMAAVQAIAEDGTPEDYHLDDVSTIRGMAPQCKVLSLRIFDDDGDGDDAAAMQALEYVMELNSNGAHVRVHGVNISAGYLPDPTSYGIGQSPLCRTIDRIVRSGVVVVCAAGNFGWTPGSANADGTYSAGQSGALASIADPGNANLAITVGSTHRQEPHTFGVSFFSSKGPTADGRMKPDVVAPGERIISCATGDVKSKVSGYLTAAPGGAVASFDYAEDSGTSMAAPHVSGVVAAFLSVRREFIGDAERVTEMVRSSAMNLNRDPRMQGAGLVDLFRMLQSV